MWCRMSSIISLVVVAISVVVSPAATAQDAAKTTHVTVAAGSIGGSYFIMNTAMFDIFSKHLDALRSFW